MDPLWDGLGYAIGYWIQVLFKAHIYSALAVSVRREREREREREERGISSRQEKANLRRHERGVRRTF